MNYERIYRYRFQGIDRADKISTWKVISEFIYKKLGCPEKIIDPAAGDCEFINQVRSKEKWAIDKNPRTQDHAGVDVKVIIADYRDADLPKDYFDAVYVSNFLEHLP